MPALPPPHPQGAKLQYGHVPLYESGDNPNAKQFHSLHAVQVRRGAGGRGGRAAWPAGLFGRRGHTAIIMLCVLVGLFRGGCVPRIPCPPLPPCTTCHPAPYPPLLQRHMVDANRCKMAYDGNEDEYEDFYDYGGEGGEAEGQAEGGGAAAEEAMPQGACGAGWERPRSRCCGLGRLAPH